ncbi:unnamed protein product, partial [Medioppia subpectinata]
MDSNSDSDYTERQTKRRKHDKKTGGQFVCDLKGCGRIFNARISLISHKRSHLGLTYRCHVLGCGRKYKNRKCFINHKRIHSSRTYRCDVVDCRSVFATKAYLILHKRRRH